jgi:hypothetical protein
MSSFIGIRKSTQNIPQQIALSLQMYDKESVCYEVNIEGDSLPQVGTMIKINGNNCLLVATDSLWELSKPNLVDKKVKFYVDENHK